MALVLAATVLGYREWLRGFAYLSVADAAGAPVAQGLLEIFEWNESGSARSPSDRLGEQPFEDGTQITLDKALVRGESLVRVTAPGLGATYALVTPGGTIEQCSIGPPRSLAGVIRDPQGRGVVGARVAAFGGGRHGVLLSETTTATDGRFQIEGLSATLSVVLLRVLKESCMVAEEQWWFDAEQKREIQLVRTESIGGRLVLPEGDGGVHRVQAFGLPGVEAAVGGGGSFELDHVPPAPTRTVLVVPTLGPGLTHARVSCLSGERDLAIQVYREAFVEGQVIDAVSGLGLATATVRHDYGPRGVVTVKCGADGQFRIGLLPVGQVALECYVQREEMADNGMVRKVWRHARTELNLEEGETRKGVALMMYQ